jgi:peptidylprolyl isomerase
MTTPAIRFYVFLLLCCLGAACAKAWAAGRTTAEVLSAATAADWREVAPQDTLYLDLPGGRVVIELAPAFAPRHAANIRALAEARYWDGLAVVRSQENYVVQWGDPAAGTDSARSLGKAAPSLPPEFERAAEGLPFARLADGDVYAPDVGFSGGFPAARDPERGKAWLAHCNAMVGAGRGNTADSGNGAELYVVIGHAPRHLDRNITLVGRVLRGMEHLSTLPRGSGPLGFYEQASQHVPIRALRLASTLPPAQRTPLQVLRTDTELFAAYVGSRRHRREPWFLDPVGHVSLCNVPIPVRDAPPAAQHPSH